jgi:hypothetical protein
MCHDTGNRLSCATEDFTNQEGHIHHIPSLSLITFDLRKYNGYLSSDPFPNPSIKAASNPVAKGRPAPIQFAGDHQG